MMVVSFLTLLKARVPDDDFVVIRDYDSLFIPETRKRSVITDVFNSMFIIRIGLVI